MAESESGGGGYVQLPADCVTMCAESLGITQLAQDVVPALTEDVNYRVREATQVLILVPLCFYAPYVCIRMPFSSCDMLRGGS